jgi:hypothetical protein
MSNEKIEEKVEEHFAVDLNYDVNALNSIVQFFNSVKEHCNQMAGENTYYREVLSRRFFEISTDVNVLGLRLELLQFKLVQYISTVKVLMIQDKKPIIENEKFDVDVRLVQEKLQSDLLLLHGKLLQLTQDVQREAKENFGAYNQRKEPL